jgi:hypothetical protein
VGWFDDLPRSADDIELIEGSPGDLRSSAADLRTLAAGLDTVRSACVDLCSVTDGSSWYGQGFDAFREAVDRNPQPSDIDNAQRTIEGAAAILEALADGVERCQGDIDWCRQRMTNLGLHGDDIPDELRGEVEVIDADAGAARSDHARHLRDAGTALAALTEDTIYAEPPPGFWDQVGDVLGVVGGQVWEFCVGIVEGVWEMVKGVVMIVAFVVQPWKWDDAWETIKQVVQFAIAHPDDFFLLVGQAIIDWETLRDNPARWLGKLVPNILLALATGGAGTVASRATAVAARLPRVHRLMNAVARPAMKVDDLMRPLGGRAKPANWTRDMGRRGDELSQQKWSRLGYDRVGGQVRFRSLTTTKPDGTLYYSPVDHVMRAPGGKPLAVESKNGLSANLSENQQVVYPELSSVGAELRSPKLVGEGMPVGSTQVMPVAVDHWYSPIDAPSVTSQVGLQVGAGGVSVVGRQQ